MRYMLTITSLCMLTFSAGCSTLATGKSSSKDAWSLSKLWKKEYQIPEKMVTIWSHDILASSHAAPTRGFGGRVYFYNGKSQPIPVEGELIVHGFEEKPGMLREYTTQSDKRFRFTPEQFTQHYSESDLGASYSVWIPWDGVDGLRKEITLIPTFKTASGQIVQGSASKLVLPGKELPGMGPAPTNVQTVSFQQTSSAPTIQPAAQDPPSIRANESGLSTTTININPRAGQRLLSQPTTSATQPSSPAAGGFSHIKPESYAKVDAILEQLKRLNQPNLVATATGGHHSDSTPASGAAAANVHNLTPPPNATDRQSSSFGTNSTKPTLNRGF